MVLDRRSKMSHTQMAKNHISHVSVCRLMKKSNKNPVLKVFNAATELAPYWGGTMIRETTGKQTGVVAHDETVGKVFIVVSADTRRCLICNQQFTRQGSFEHTKIVCHPPASAAN